MRKVHGVVVCMRGATWVGEGTWAMQIERLWECTEGATWVKKGLWGSVDVLAVYERCYAFWGRHAGGSMDWEGCMHIHRVLHGSCTVRYGRAGSVGKHGSVAWKVCGDCVRDAVWIGKGTCGVA